MPLSKLFPDLENVEKIETIWRLFYEININILNNNWTSEVIQ